MPKMPKMPKYSFNEMSADNEGVMILGVSSADINEDVKSTTIDVNYNDN